MRYKERKLHSVGDLLRALGKHRPPGVPVWFRGQAKASWRLIPSLARRPRTVKLEQSLAKRFKQNALLMLSSRPQNEWEWMFVMQHHVVPTRLLDWTESPLVGLYFAVNECPKSDGALWALLPVQLNQLANAPGAGQFDIPAFEEDKFLENYLPSRLASERQSELKTVAFLAPRNTARSQMQLAVFTITHRDLTPIEDIGNKRHVWRYIVSAGDKKQIQRELEYLHITKLTLSPELDNVGEHAREIL